MRKLFLLFVALLATTCLWAQRFQVGDLFYEIPSEDFTIPAVSSPGAGRTTVVLYVPWNTPAGCYAVGTVNNWDERNTDLMFTPVEGANSERWVACTFDYAEDMQIKVLALPFDPAIAPSWSYQWGKNMDPENDLVEDNVVILEGAGYLELENQGEPKLVELADNGVVYIEIKDWAANPIIESVPCETAAFRHPWGGGDWVYREAIKTAEGTFELNARYGGMGINVAADIYGYNQAWYPEDQIEFVGDIAQGDSVNFKFISEKSTYVGRMIVTLIEKGTGSYDASWYIPGKNSPTPQQKSSSADSPRQVVVTYQHEWSSENYHYLTEANIPATIEYRGETYEVIGIREGAFANSPITSVTIPNSVTSIGGEAFQDCSSLTSIAIPNSITSIGNYAFAGCSSLTSITIPNSITEINSGIFANCSSLTSITIPNSVTSIGNDAFYGCSSLTSITIPNSVTSIGEVAFSSCSSLTSITIPNSVTSIGNGAFCQCFSLEYLSIPNSVKYADGEYYYGGFDGIMNCPNLKTLIVPGDFFGEAEEEYQHVKSDILPYLPEQLESLTVNDGTIHRLAWDFINRNYKTLKTIDLATTTDIAIAEEAFKNCYKLEKLTLPSQLENIPYMAIAECVKLQSITIPATVTEIEDRAFENCRSIKSIIFEGAEPAQGPARHAANATSLWRIGSWAFYNCHQLQNLTIPEGVTEVGDAAFYGCTYLEDMVLPSTIQEIGDNGFALCAKLKKMHVKATTPPTIQAKTFFDVNRQIPVYVPDNAVEAYKADPYWQEFNIIGKSNAPSAVDNISSPDANTHKLLRNGQLYILRDGKTYNIMGAEVK